MQRLYQSFLSPTLLCIFCLLIFSCEKNNRLSETAPSNPTAADSTFGVETLKNPAFYLNQLGDSALQQGDYTRAITLFQQSMDTAAARADSFMYFDSKLDLACVHDRLDELPKSIEIGLTVLEGYLRSGDSTRIGRCYSTLAAFYGRAGMEAENLDCTRKGFDILKNHGSLIERCAAYNQMAFTFSGREQWAEALPLLDTALQLMRASGVLDQLPSIYLNLGNCHRKLQHWSPAQLYLQSAADLADSLRQAHVYAVALLRLSQVAESTGDYANALRLFQQSRTIRDSLFTDEKTRTMQELEVQYQTREKEQQVQLLESRHHAEVQRRNFILALLLLGLALGLWQWRNWRKKLREAQDELHRFAQTLLAKNSRLTELEQALHSNPTPSDQAATAPEITDEPDDAPQEDLYQRHILTESDWTAFKHHFDRSYPGFRQRLRKNFPELTSAEERLFLLLKLNFSSKEAAAMQGISQESIKKNRYRLRKRLGLEHDEGLEGFVRGF